MVVAFLSAITITTRCCADSSVEFIPADQLAASQEILGYVVVDNGDETSTIHVLASTLISSIERRKCNGCVSEYSATSGCTGEQLVLSIDATGTASFAQDGVVVGTLSADYCGGIEYSGSAALPDSLVYKAVLAAAMDTNLSLIRPCQGQAAFDIALNQTFERDNRIWIVPSVTIGVTDGGQTSVIFSAHSNQDLEDWSISISSESSIAQSATVNGQLKYSLQRSGADVSVTTPTGSATVDISQVATSASVQALLHGISSSIDFAQEVMQATSAAAEPTQVEVEEQCRQLCNDSLPYGSNCQTFTEKYDCCVTDVQRAVCRRACVCEYYAGTWWSHWCAVKAGVLFDIDLAACVAAFLKAWD